MSITDAARIDALFKKLQARTNTGTGISLSSEASSISHVYSTQMGALPVPYPPPSDADITASYPWIVKKTAITYNEPLGAPSYRAYIDSRVTNIIPYYPITVTVGGSGLSANKYILDFDTGAIVIYTAIEGAPTITFYQYNDQFSTQRSFTLDGSGAVFYPIVFTISPKAFNDGSYAINVWRSDVHENGSYKGTFDLKVRGRPYLWGHDADYLEWKYVNRMGSTVTRFIGNVINTDKNFSVVVWLRGGGLTYYWSGTGISGVDTSLSTTKTLTTGSETVTSLSAVNTYFDHVTGSWDSRTKQLILDGVLNDSVGLHNDLGNPSFPSTTSGSTNALEVNGTTNLAGSTTISTGGLTVSAGGAKVTGDFYAANMVKIGSTTEAPSQALDVKGSGIFTENLTISTPGYLNHRLPVVHLKDGKKYSDASGGASWGDEFGFTNTMPTDPSGNGNRVWWKDTNYNAVRVWLNPYPTIYIINRPTEGATDVNVYPQIPTADQSSMVGCYWYFVDRCVNPYLSFPVKTGQTGEYTDGVSSEPTSASRPYRQFGSNRMLTLLCIGEGNCTITA